MRDIIHPLHSDNIVKEIVCFFRSIRISIASEVYICLHSIAILFFLPCSFFSKRVKQLKLKRKIVAHVVVFVEKIAFSCFHAKCKMIRICWKEEGKYIRVQRKALDGEGVHLQWHVNQVKGILFITFSLFPLLCMRVYLLQSTHHVTRVNSSSIMCRTVSLIYLTLTSPRVTFYTSHSPSSLPHAWE